MANPIIENSEQDVEKVSTLLLSEEFAYITLLREYLQSALIEDALYKSKFSRTWQRKLSFSIPHHSSHFLMRLAMLHDAGKHHSAFTSAFPTEELSPEQEGQILSLFNEIGDRLSSIDSRLDTIHSLFEDNIRDVKEANDVLRLSNELAFVRAKERSPA